MISVIQVSNLSKSYRLGTIGSRTISEDINRWWAKLRKQPDPYLRIGQEDMSNRIGERIWALKNINFEVQQGEVLGIIGRNGAGKSTLLKILSRVTAPTSGEVRVKGRIASLLEVGTGFHPELTGRENVFLNGAILGMKRQEIERRFDEIVDFSGVERFIDTPVKRYSSGMYVRLAFAVAAHLEPEILVVDEVLAVGDAEFQKKCLGKMGEVAGQGRTVLFVSHNMGAIQQLCPNAILICNGQISQQGGSSSVISYYLDDAIKTQSGEFDLGKHPARLQKFFPIIKSIRLIGKGNATSSIFFSGDPIIVELTLAPPKTIQEPRIAITIEDRMMRRITTFASYFEYNKISEVTENCVVRCHIPSLLLGADDYLIGASIATKQDGLLDSVDGAAWFKVEWNNYYGNNEPYHKYFGPLLSRSHWQLIYTPSDQ